MVTDLTARAPVESAVFDQIDVALCVVDADGAVLHSNVAWRRETGLGDEALAGRSVIAHLFDLAANGRTLLERAREAERVSVGAHRFPCRLEPLALPGCDAVLFVALDVSDRRTVAESTERLQDVSIALASAITPAEIAQVVFDRGLRPTRADGGTLCLLVEPGTLAMSYVHGGPPGLAASYGLFPVSAPLPVSHAVCHREPLWIESLDELRARFPAMVEAARAVGHSAWAVLPLPARDGEPLGALGLAYAEPHAFTEPERRFIVALADQCAQALDRARLYDAERAARAEAERQRGLQELLLAVVGHDLRGPLSSIGLGAQALARNDRLDAAGALAVDRVRRSALHARRLIADILDFTRVRQGFAVRLEREPVDLVEVLTHVLAELHERDRARVDVIDAGPARLDGDPVRLGQVLSNLVTNALRHGDGGVVRVRLDGDDAVARVAVHNGGRPIDAAALPTLFDPFHRNEGGDAEGAQQGSLGLGLFIVRELVQAHGGELVVRSTGEEGTTFEVRLPRAPVDGALT